NRVAVDQTSSRPAGAARFDPTRSMYWPQACEQPIELVRNHAPIAQPIAREAHHHVGCVDAPFVETDARHWTGAVAGAAHAKAWCWLIVDQVLALIGRAVAECDHGQSSRPGRSFGGSRWWVFRARPRVGSAPPQRAHGGLFLWRRWRPYAIGRMVAVRVRVLAKGRHSLRGPSARVLWQVPSRLAPTAEDVPIPGAAVRNVKVADKPAPRGLPHRAPPLPPSAPAGKGSSPPPGKSTH